MNEELISPMENANQPETQPASIRGAEGTSAPLLQPTVDSVVVDPISPVDGANAPQTVNAAAAATPTSNRQPRGATGQRSNDLSRYSALPVKDLLKIRMKELNIKNVELQRTLGYPKSNVIAMMKSGAMQLPAHKVLDAARLLELDPVFLLGKVIAEKDPELWRVILALLGNELITDNEMKLIHFVREGLGGHDVDLLQTPGFVQSLTQHVKAASDRAGKLARAAIERRAT